MKKESIIHFVRFITELELEQFVPQWEVYASDCLTGTKPLLLQQYAESRNRYKFVSKHECKENDFRFAFMKGKNSEHFPEQKVRVVLAGGYIPLQMEFGHSAGKPDLSILVFLDHNEYDIDAYRALATHQKLNIFQAYYESCAFGHILEFGISESGSQDILQQIQSKAGAEAALYRECMPSHA